MPPLPSSLRAGRSAVAVQFALMGATTGSWASRIPGVRAQVGLDDAQWGLATVASTLGSLASLFVVIGLINRIGPRRMALTGAVLLVVNAPLLAASQGAPALVIGLLVQGAATGLLAPSMNAQAVEVERRYGRRIMSSFHATFSFGQLTGGVLGILAARTGVSPSTQLAASGAVLLVLLAGAYRHLPADPPAVPRPRQTTPWRSRITRQLGLLAVIALLESINEGAAVQWSAQYTAGTLAAGAGLGAATFTCFSVAMALSRTVGDRVSTPVGPRRFLQLCGSVAAIGLGLGLVIGTTWSALLGFALLGLGSAGVIPTLMGLAGNQPGIPAGRGVSVVSFGQWPAFLVGPPLIGAIAGAVGLRSALFLLVAAGITIAVLAQAVRPPVAGERLIASA